MQLFKKYFVTLQRSKTNIEMLTPYTISDYGKEYQPEWVCDMPEGCPPNDVLVPKAHPFFRLAKQADTYDESDFKTYAETCPQRPWGISFPWLLGFLLLIMRLKLAEI